MKNRSGVARALIDNREFTIWLRAAAKERMSVISFVGSVPAGRLAAGSARFCSYFGGIFFLVGGVTYVPSDSPILLPDLTQI